MLVQDTTFTPSLPIALKIGDANLDGFPDLLAITVSESGNNHIPNLVYSVSCGNFVAGCPKGADDRRGWKLATKGAKVLEDVKDARALTFLDLDEDVRIFLLFYMHTIPNFVMLTGHFGYHGPTHWR